MRKSIKDLKLGFSDAQNYTIRANKTIYGVPQNILKQTP